MNKKIKTSAVTGAFLAILLLSSCVTLNLPKPEKPGRSMLLIRTFFDSTYPGLAKSTITLSDGYRKYTINIEKPRRYYFIQLPPGTYKVVDIQSTQLKGQPQTFMFGGFQWGRYYIPRQEITYDTGRGKGDENDLYDENQGLEIQLQRGEVFLFPYKMMDGLTMKILEQDEINAIIKEVRNGKNYGKYWEIQDFTAASPTE